MTVLGATSRGTGVSPLRSIGLDLKAKASIGVSALRRRQAREVRAEAVPVPSVAARLHRGADPDEGIPAWVVVELFTARSHTTPRPKLRCSRSSRKAVSILPSRYPKRGSEPDTRHDPGNSLICPAGRHQMDRVNSFAEDGRRERPFGPRPTARGQQPAAENVGIPGLQHPDRLPESGFATGVLAEGQEPGSNILRAPGDRQVVANASSVR